MKDSNIVQRLLSWFAQNARALPWRRTHDPYAIWVSEVMLQQTQVSTVLPYWERWMRALPTLEALAKAKPQKLHKLWEGLGYYTRVRNLQRAAQIIRSQHGGQFPHDFGEVLALPGIGRYTAGAICSIAFNQPKPILDGNVIRVLTRLYGIAGNPRMRKTNARLWQLAAELVVRAARTKEVNVSRTAGVRPSSGAAGAAPGRTLGNSQTLLFADVAAPEDGRTPTQPPPTVVRASRAQTQGVCSQFNQSLMELGALICTPRQPRCAECPVAKCCVAYQQNRVDQLPALSPRVPATSRRFVAFVVQQMGCFLVRQRPADVVNAHLWEFPNLELAPGDSDLKGAARSALGMRPEKIEALATFKHSITRYRITLEAYRVTARRGATISAAKGRWLGPRQLYQLAFASAHKRILRRLGQGEDWNGEETQQH
jgi:A/G-specific adenine glycosylase